MCVCFRFSMSLRIFVFPNHLCVISKNNQLSQSSKQSSHLDYLPLHRFHLRIFVGFFVRNDMNSFLFVFRRYPFDDTIVRIARRSNAKHSFYRFDMRTGSSSICRYRQPITRYQLLPLIMRRIYTSKQKLTNPYSLLLSGSVYLLIFSG